MLKFKIVGGSKLVYNHVSDMLCGVVNYMIDEEDKITHMEIFNINNELHIKFYNTKQEIRFVGKLNTEINEHNIVRDKLTVMYKNCSAYAKYPTDTDVRIDGFREDSHYEYYFDHLDKSIMVWNQLLVDLCDLIDLLQYMAVI